MNEQKNQKQEVGLHGDLSTNRGQQIFPTNPRNAVEAVNLLLEFALAERASDIHIDPRKNDIAIRLRIDGQIGSVGLLPKRLHEEMIARLKILSGARTDLHVVPQDGRWHANIAEVECNMRISFMPTYHGENAVIRILKAQAIGEVSFAKLGFTPDHVQTIADALQASCGLILVTGPTGSGKTTTLHACLSQKVKEPISVISLEDPIEYEIEGLRQVHIRPSHGVTFANGLRSTLRQDPDVIMLGEIRDNETARVAIHTALTGHLVLSTLHTNSALDAIPRLVDMGIDHYLLASTLKLTIAQRLIRNICRQCLGEGCEVCRQSGYYGRSIIAEVSGIDSGMRKLIVDKRPVADCVEYAKSNGFRPMYEDGMEKVDWGITDRTEVMRVLYEQ